MGPRGAGSVLVSRQKVRALRKADCRAGLGGGVGAEGSWFPQLREGLEARQVDARDVHQSCIPIDAGGTR